MTRTVDDAIRHYKVIFSGRTRYEGQEPRDDELLVAEIKRLRGIIMQFKVLQEVLSEEINQLQDRIDAFAKDLT